MACDIDFIDFVCCQLDGVGMIRTRKMFGDYCIYVNEKPLILCCDNIAYIPKHPAIDGLMADAECGFPFEGSKEKYILDVEHGSEARRIVSILEGVTPFPKPKKSRRTEASGNVNR